jgi:hypothetical protein
MSTYFRIFLKLERVKKKQENDSPNTAKIVHLVYNKHSKYITRKRILELLLLQLLIWGYNSLFLAGLNCALSIVLLVHVGTTWLH